MVGDCHAAGLYGSLREAVRGIYNVRPLFVWGYQHNTPKYTYTGVGGGDFRDAWPLLFSDIMEPTDIVMVVQSHWHVMSYACMSNGATCSADRNTSISQSMAIHSTKLRNLRDAVKRKGGRLLLADDVPMLPQRVDRTCRGTCTGTGYLSVTDYNAYIAPYRDTLLALQDNSTSVLFYGHLMCDHSSCNAMIPGTNVLWVLHFTRNLSLIPTLTVALNHKP